jgi:hypothetical protein
MTRKQMVSFFYDSPTDYKYVMMYRGFDEVCLDSWFTAKELRMIADALEYGKDDLEAQ